MAVNCAACGQSMSIAEVTQRPYDGVAGNYHRDCAYMEYLVNSGPVQVSTSRLAELVLSKDKLNKKHIAQGVPTPAAPSGTLAAGTNLGIGAYTYGVGFVSKEGQTVPGTTFPITTTTGNQKVNLTAIPTGPASTSSIPLTIARVIYRTAVGGGQLKVLAVINNNTTTTFSDTIADSSLGANAPAVGNFCGADFP